MTSQLPTLCLSCRHLDPSRDDLGARRVLTCRAYPTGIPTDIRRAGDHHAPRGDEQDGLRYDQAHGLDAAMDLRAWQAFTAA